jgi:hypothetical protein
MTLNNIANKITMILHFICYQPLTLHLFILQEHYIYIIQKQYMIITYFINKIFNDIPLRITVTISLYQDIFTLLTQLMLSLTIKPAAVSAC